jgi:hypothetical protein
MVETYLGFGCFDGFVLAFYEVVRWVGGLTIWLF